MCIGRERERLRGENEDMRRLLKQYLEGISVSDRVLDAPNPLLVVNHKTNIVAPQYRLPSPTTVIEGAHTCMLSELGKQGASF